MDDKMYKEFLESQLQWSKNQIAILDEMEVKLHEMKEIAEYAAENDLSLEEREKLNRKLEVLKSAYNFLEVKRTSSFT